MKLALLDFQKPKLQILLRVYDEKSIYLHRKINNNRNRAAHF